TAVQRRLNASAGRAKGAGCAWAVAARKARAIEAWMACASMESVAGRAVAGSATREERPAAMARANAEWSRPEPRRGNVLFISSPFACEAARRGPAVNPKLALS